MRYVRCRGGLIAAAVLCLLAQAPIAAAQPEPFTDGTRLDRIVTTALAATDTPAIEDDDRRGASDTVGAANGRRDADSPAAAAGANGPIGSTPPDGSAEPRLAEWIRLAKREALATRPRWLALLHYPIDGGHSPVSRIDATHFFLSGAGGRDPEAELLATIAGLLDDGIDPPRRLPVACRYAARRVWLERRLGPAFARGITSDCPEYERYREHVAGSTLTLVFPTSHPDSPSSAFGHTLLRIDRPGQTAAERMLNLSINYAADVPPGTGGVRYAVDGLTGGFEGRYRLLPFHVKLREYAQIENRDLWEYPLRLDAAEVDWVLAHLYEVLIAHHDYRFLSENCAYQLLALLDVAMPEQPLTPTFPRWTIPVDTIRLLAHRDLLGTPRFTPSMVRALAAQEAALPHDDRALALTGLAHGPDGIDAALERLPVDRQVAVLDLLIEYQRFERVREDPNALRPDATERTTLTRRAGLAVRSPVRAIAAPLAPPETGHGTSRFVGAWRRLDSTRDLAEIGFRPAYHDARDPVRAYGRRASIELGEIRLGVDRERERAFLRELSVFRIASLEPRGDFFKPISWHSSVFWDRHDTDASHRAVFNVGAGGSWTISARTVTYAQLESDLVDEPDWPDRTSLRVGASAGIRFDPGDAMRAGVELDYRRQFGAAAESARVELWSSIAIGPAGALVIALAREHHPARDDLREASLEWRYYF